MKAARLAVEEGGFGGGGDGDAEVLGATGEEVHALGSHADGEHYAGVDTLIGSSCNGRTYSDTNVGTIECTGYSYGLLATRRETTVAAIQPHHLRLCCDNQNTVSLQDIVAVTLVNRSTGLLKHLQHYVGELLDIVSGKQTTLKDVNTLSLRGSAGGSQHFAAGLNYALRTACSFLDYHGTKLKLVVSH
jgi:hypothetical protein